ncbi:universal stress protein [Streptomyces sp. NPDC000888]
MSQWPPHERRSGEHRPHPSDAILAPEAVLAPWRDPRFRHGVVVGYTGSPSSERALAYASGMAQRAGAGLVVVRVTHDWPAADWCHDGEPMVVIGLPDDGADDLTDVLTCTGQLTQVPWVAVHTRGDIRNGLEEISRQYAADAIVVGASRSIAARLFSCVGSRLARHPGRPVIIVP